MCPVATGGSDVPPLLGAHLSKMFQTIFQKQRPPPTQTYPFTSAIIPLLPSPLSLLSKVSFVRQNNTQMLRRTVNKSHWFWDLYHKEQTENLHHKRPEISETYTRLSQGLERIDAKTPDTELSPFEYALKQAVLPISDALPVPRNIDPCYLSVNGEPVPQSWKFLPNQQLYEHIQNSHLQWKLHPFESIISPNPSGYLEPLGPVQGNEDLPYAVIRTHMGKLPLTMQFKSQYVL